MEFVVQSFDRDAKELSCFGFIALHYIEGVQDVQLSTSAKVRIFVVAQQDRLLRS